MKSYNDDNDITTRDIILIASMLGITLLSLLGLVRAIDDSFCELIWSTLSGDETLQCFNELWSSMLC